MILCLIPGRTFVEIFYIKTFTNMKLVELKNLLIDKYLVRISNVLIIQNID